MATHKERESGWNYGVVIMGILMLAVTDGLATVGRDVDYFTVHTTVLLGLGWFAVFGLLGWRWWIASEEAEGHIAEEVGLKNGALARLEDERAAHRESKDEIAVLRVRLRQLQSGDDLKLEAWTEVDGLVLVPKEAVGVPSGAFGM